MTRDNVDWEMPVTSARARWLRPAATRACSILAPISATVTAPQPSESESMHVIQCTRRPVAPLPELRHSAGRTALALAIILSMADIGWLAAASMHLADLRTPTLADEAADGDPGGVSGRNETGNPPTYTAAVDRFLFALLNPLAEDKRFELLRVSPTRFPIMLLTVQRQSGTCVTRCDGTERTVPTGAERPRMRRKLRRTGRRHEPTWVVKGVGWRCHRIRTDLPCVSRDRSLARGLSDGVER